MRSRNGLFSPGHPEADLPGRNSGFSQKTAGGEAVKKITANALLDQYIQSLLVYFDNPELADEELVVLKLQEFILLLLKTDQARSVLELVSDLFNPREFALKEVVENHVYNDTGVEELAFLCGMSLSNFKREFSRIYNESPGQYLRGRKLERASELLRVSDLRITDIAYDCGFNDLANFSTAFHKKFGASPKRYRMDRAQKLSD